MRRGFLLSVLCFGGGLAERQQRLDHHRHTAAQRALHQQAVARPHGLADEGGQRLGVGGVGAAARWRQPLVASGRASCRERAWQSGWCSVVVVSLKKTTYLPT